MERIICYLSAEQIAERIRTMGAEIQKDYQHRSLVMVAVLKGAFMFASDLMRAIDMNTLKVEFLGVRSYGEGTETTGVVQITSDLTQPIQDQDVLVVEDIVDTGLTMSYLLDMLQTRKPRSIKVCSLLHKPARARVAVPIDYLGFTIDDRFVVGYGLDFAERYRNLPYIGVLESST